MKKEGEIFEIDFDELLVPNFDKKDQYKHFVNIIRI